MIFTDTHKLNKSAFDALKRIRTNKEKTLELVQESETNQVAKKKFSLAFNEFDEIKFNNKIKLDAYVYNKLLENIGIDDKPEVSQLISEMLNDVREIYRFINIEPKSLGFRNMTPDDAPNLLLNEASNIVNNHFKSHMIAEFNWVFSISFFSLDLKLSKSPTLED